MQPSGGSASCKLAGEGLRAVGDGGWGLSLQRAMSVQHCGVWGGIASDRDALIMRGCCDVTESLHGGSGVECGSGSTCTCCFDVPLTRVFVWCCSTCPTASSALTSSPAALSSSKYVLEIGVY